MHGTYISPNRKNSEKGMNYVACEHKSLKIFPGGISKAVQALFKCRYLSRFQLIRWYFRSKRVAIKFV